MDGLQSYFLIFSVGVGRLQYHNILVIYMVGLKFWYMWPRVLY